MIALKTVAAKQRQDLYHKTTFDAAMRYSMALEELEINLEYHQIALLLHMASIPEFRDRIYTLFLYAPESDDADDSAATFRASSEAIHLLSRCFHILADAKNLGRIELCDQDGHGLVLEALRLAKFPRQVAHFQIEPKRLVAVGYGCLSSEPEACAPYLEGLQLRPSFPDEDHSAHNMTDEERQENPLGRHIRNYRPSTPAFHKVVSSFSGITSLELHGCRSSSTLRICHACDDLFANTFASVHFHNLRTLMITSILISGGRLRRFIKRHALTLRTLDMSHVTLTDGSWRSVAQGLAKLPHLQDLNLIGLRQKRPESEKYPRPPNFLAANMVRLDSACPIQLFLKVFVQSFDAVLCTNPARFDWSRPKYFEAKLFQLPGVAIPSGEMKSVAALREYAGFSAPTSAKRM